MIYIRNQREIVRKMNMRTDFNTALGVKEDIVGLDVAMNDGLVM